MLINTIYKHCSVTRDCCQTTTTTCTHVSLLLMSVVHDRERVRRYEEIGTFWSERGAGKTAADEQRRMEVYTYTCIL
jgi:hypothetical protein